MVLAIFLQQIRVLNIFGLNSENCHYDLFLGRYWYETKIFCFINRNKLIDDVEAKKGLNTTNKNITKVIWNDFITKSTENVKKKWQALWHNETKGRLLYKMKHTDSLENTPYKEEVL